MSTRHPTRREMEKAAEKSDRKKKLKAPKAEDLTDEQVGILIHLAMVERRYLEEKLRKCIERLNFFSKGKRPLLPVLVNEAYLLLRHAARLGVTPSYYESKKRAKVQSSV